MSNNDNNNNRSANVIADAVEFAEGSVYNSKMEMYAAMRSDRYKTDLVYRAKVDAKMALSVRGKTVEGVSTEKAGPTFVTARETRTADGRLSGEREIRAVDMSEMNGETRPTESEVASGIRVEHKPGDALRVTVRSSTVGPKGDKSVYQRPEPPKPTEPSFEDVMKDRPWTLIKPIVIPPKK